MKSYELALKAGRLRQSAVTQFVHDLPENPDHAWEAIPIYENFCFVLALFRSKTAEAVLEGKALLERLFAFQTEKGFPVYLHDYPHCSSRRLAQKISVVARFLLRDFTPVLGEILREKLQSIVLPFETCETPASPENWADYLIESQLSGIDPTPALRWWDPKALCYTGSQKQERGEPAVTLYDLILGEWTGAFSKRALMDHPAHILASLIYPQTISDLVLLKQWKHRFWGEGTLTHSALLHAQGEIFEKGDTIEIHLPSKAVYDEVEICYFLNKHPAMRFLINGASSTTFQLNEKIRVQSGDQTFEMIFSLLEGSGRFWGHLYFANRPGQIGCKGALKHEAFDWAIGLRTIEREEAARLKIEFCINY